jgi:hypothetical protein
MRRIEELAALQPADVFAVLPRVITDQVEFIARSRRVARALVKENRDLVGAKGRFLYVPSRTQVSIGTGVAPGTDISGSTFILSSGSNFLNAFAAIGVYKVVAGIQLSQEALDGAFIDVIDSGIEEAGLALADQEDKDIITEMYIDGQNASSILLQRRTFYLIPPSWMPLPMEIGELS